MQAIDYLSDIFRYYSNVSTPSRAVLLAVRNLSVDVEVIMFTHVELTMLLSISFLIKFNPRCLGAVKENQI